MTDRAETDRAETHLVTCRACNGTGRSPYRDGQTCDQCDGFGKRLGTSIEAATDRLAHDVGRIYDVLP